MSNKKHKLEKDITYVVFDGNYVGVGESPDPDNLLTQIVKFNPNVDILADGYGITRFETDLLFAANIIQRNETLTWYHLDKDGVELIINMVVDVSVFNEFIREDDDDDDE